MQLRHQPRAERRDSYRIEIGIPVQVSWRSLSDRVTANGVLHDVSIRGIAVILPRQLAIGTTVDVDLAVEIPIQFHLGYDISALVVTGQVHEHEIRLRCRVVHCEPSLDANGAEDTWRIGLHIIGARTEEDTRSLHCYIDHLFHE